MQENQIASNPAEFNTFSPFSASLHRISIFYMFAAALWVLHEASILTIKVFYII